MDSLSESSKGQVTDGPVFQCHGCLDETLAPRDRKWVPESWNNKRAAEEWYAEVKRLTAEYQEVKEEWLQEHA